MFKKIQQEWQKKNKLLIIGQISNIQRGMTPV
jgi:hypothetical protein